MSSTATALRPDTCTTATTAPSLPRDSNIAASTPSPPNLQAYIHNTIITSDPTKRTGTSPPGPALAQHNPHSQPQPQQVPAAFRFPSLHLGSFDSLSQSTSSSPSPPPSTSGAQSSGTPASVTLPTPEEGSIVLLQPPLSSSFNGKPPPVVDASIDRQHSSSSEHPSVANTLLSPPAPSGSHQPGTSRRLSPSPVGLPAASAVEASSVRPPTLGSLPLLSPISPLDTNSLARFKLNDTTFTDDDFDSNAATPHPPELDNSQRSSLAWSPPPPLASPVGGRSAIASFNSLSSRNSRHSILSPEPLTPTSRTSFDDLASPRLRDSPGVPRRRTIVVASPAAGRVSPATAAPITLSPPPQEIALNSSVEDAAPPSPSPTPKRLITRRESASSLTPTTNRQQQRPPGLAFPEPRVASEACSSTAIGTDRPPSAIDATTAGQDPSHSRKRSLPRPPRANDSDNATPVVLNRQSQASSQDTMSMSLPMPMPVPHSTRATSRPALQVSTSPKTNFPAPGIVASDPTMPKRISRASQQQQERTLVDKSYSLDNNAPMVETRTVQPKQSAMDAPTPMPMPYTRNHQPTKSASNFPAIAGLADAGPYPTAQPPMGGQNQRPLAGARNGNALQPPQGFKPTEEVCLECMMRDRDLADVDVTGADAWERESTAAFEDLKSREYDLLRSASLDHSTSVFSLDEASIESESVSSPLSHTSTLPEDRAAQQKRQQHREARRAKIEEQDQLISRIGWRGFKWEEGSGGEGFPRGFRGTKPGALTEKGIKNVMTMYPSSSALRFQILQGYLRGQYRLIIETRQEAQRLGHYPEPEEVVYPHSPTLPSSEGASSSHEARRTTRLSVEQGAPSIKAQSISTARSAPVTMQQVPTLRQSPSTPALNKSRPVTNYLPEREAAGTSSRTSRPSLSNITSAVPSPQSRPQHLKGPSISTSTMPKGRESRFYAGDDWSDTEDLWPPTYDDMSPSSGNLRPFSFAVRAGAQGHDSRPGSISSQRRSFFGRFGDSVTSLFTGSHGGSGSMMDMHLGLDMDRRNRTSSYQAHENPRVSTLVSPGRPVLQSRQSLGTSVYLGGGGAQPPTPGAAGSTGAPSPVDDAPVVFRDRRARSASASRLTQMSMYNDFDQSPKKKGGIKGLLQKMKKGGNKKDRNESSSPQKNQEDGTSSDLAPPPPMNFLVSRGERDHNRQRSSSSISAANNDSQASLGMASSGGSPQLGGSPQFGGSPQIPNGRSVSAPMGSGSGSDVSPTSSRFPVDGPRRRTADQVPELPPGAAESGYRRGSTMEMLANSSSASPPLAVVMPDSLVEEPQSMVRENYQPRDNYQREYQQPAYRKSMQPSLSSRYSTSTTTVPAIETPDPASSATYMLPQHGSAGNLSPNRYKNLPSLPAQGYSPDPASDGDAQSVHLRQQSMYDKRISSASSDPRIMHPRAPSMGSDTPTLYRAGIPPSQDYFPTASPRFHQPTLAPSSSASSIGTPPPLQTPVGQHPFLQPGGYYPGYQPQRLQPRASFDYLGGARAPSTSDRNAQSMYVNHSAAASTGSFGFKEERGEERKERRRGIKSIFSKK